MRELKAYFEYLYEEARARHAEGMTPLQAARSIALDRWADWGEAERLVVNIANIYAELDGEPEPLNPLVAFQQMAELSRADPGACRGAPARDGPTTARLSDARRAESRALDATRFPPFMRPTALRYPSRA